MVTYPNAISTIGGFTDVNLGKPTPNTQIASRKFSAYQLTLEFAMKPPKLLWITNNAALHSLAQWLEALSEFDVVSIPGLADAPASPAVQDMDCVLVHGPLPSEEQMRILEGLRDIDPILPEIGRAHV